MKSIVLALVALLLAVPAAAKPSAADLAAIAAYEAKIGSPAAPRTLDARMSELKVPGVSIAFIEDGKVKWTRTYGVAEAGGKRAVTPATMFQAASMSKPVAAAVALRLVEQGKLDLDKDINGQITAWQVPASPYTAEKKVTLRGLLSHSAGLTVSGFPGYAAGKPVPATVQILNGEPPSNTPAVRSWETPGKYAYSGGGFTVAQLAIAEAGLRTYGRMVEELVFGPVGMRQSTLAQPLPPKLLAKSASGHNSAGVVLAGGSNTYPEYAAAGLWTTPSDYGRFFISLQDSYDGRRGGLLRQATAQTMMTPVDGGYGLGLQLGRWGGHPYFQHAGSNAGFRCTAFAFLDGSRRGVVIMTNGDRGGQLLNEIMLALVGAYGWGERDKDTPGSPRRAPLAPAGEMTKPLVLVAAAALVDADGRVLLCQRPEGKQLAGLWEFPGGKVEAGETPEACLIRELEEELGIVVTKACLAPFVFASHEYESFHLLMPLYLIRRWEGFVRAREHKALAWVKPKDMDAYPMPPADPPLVAWLRDLI